MKIELHEIPVREVAEGYVDSAENGVRGYGGRLNIRPAFQREFIYRDRQRDEVIRTVRRNFPLNVMYWVKGRDGGPAQGRNVNVGMVALYDSVRREDNRPVIPPSSRRWKEEWKSEKFRPYCLLPDP